MATKEQKVRTDGQSFYPNDLGEFIFRYGAETVDTGLRVVDQVFKNRTVGAGEEIRKKFKEVGIQTDGDDMVLYQFVRAYSRWGDEYFNSISEQR